MTFGRMLSKVVKKYYRKIINKSAVRKTLYRAPKNGAEKVPKTTKMEPKGCQSEPKDVPQNTLGNRVEKVRNESIKLGLLFGSNTNNKSFQEIIKQLVVGRHGFDTKGMSTWSQIRCLNASKINAKTDNAANCEKHQNSVQVACANGKTIKKQ